MTTEYISIGKAAKILGISRVTMRKWADTGKVSSLRTAGYHRRFRLEDIEIYRDNNLIKGAATKKPKLLTKEELKSIVTEYDPHYDEYAVGEEYEIEKSKELDRVWNLYLEIMKGKY